MGSQTVSITVKLLQTNNNKRKTIKLNFTKETLSSTSISDLKIKLQDLLNVPVCVQTLSYLGQPLNNLSTTLSELYIRDGETIHVECPEQIDIKSLKQCTEMLKEFRTTAEPFCTSDGRYVRMPSIDDVEKFEDLYADIFEPLETLAQVFGQWKTEKVKVERQYFVQEKGMEYLMDLHVFSQRKFDWFTSSLQESSPVLTTAQDNNDDEDGGGDGFHREGEPMVYEAIRMDELLKILTEWQFILNSKILGVLWSFMETGPETKLLLEHGALKGMIDAYTMTKSDGISPFIFNDLYENALGCLCGCVEYDTNAQREVATNKEVRKKLVQAIDTGLNTNYFDLDQEYCLAANTLFYVSFDQQAIQTAVQAGVHLKVMDKVYPSVRSWLTKTKQLIICYYCLLFLARVRSSTLVTIPHNQAAAIDSCIQYFFKKGYTPSQISSYEKEHMYVWMTLAPILHLVFASGPGTATRPVCVVDVQLNDSSDAKRVKLTSQADNQHEIVDDFSSSSDSEEIFYDTDEDTTSWDTKENRQLCSGLGFSRWPGSKSVQDLGIFALQHTLSSEDNIGLLRSENLQPYLVCLVWQLQGSNRSKMRTLLAELTKSTTSVIPRLSVMCKAALATINGLDAVRHV